jgi:poly(3-hydroxybutyrate) depolymerase
MKQGGAGARAADRRPGGSGTVVRTVVFHGDRDTTVNPVNGDEVAAQVQSATALRTDVTRAQSAAGQHFTRTVHTDASGRAMLEQWVLHGAGHAWSGGSAAGSYTDPRGPDASREMVRFFLERAPQASSEAAPAGPGPTE